MILCKCGCGRELSETDSKGRPHFYIHGHNGVNGRGTFKRRWRPELAHLFSHSKEYRDLYEKLRRGKRDVSAYGYSYRAKNQEKIKATNRTHWATHKMALAPKRRAYQKAHRKEINAKQRRWVKKHWDKVLALANRRRAAKLGNHVEKYSRAEIIRRDGSRCHICRRKVRRKDIVLDHLIPIIKGGADTKANVAVAHRSCNASRGAGRFAAQLLLLS